MFNYTAFIKAIVITFRQSISIIFFNSILFCVSIRFTSLTILAKVIVINLAIFFDNALQAGFFFDDAAVEPIGIISDAVNTGNVALEYAVCVEDAAGCFRCSIGDQRRDSGSRVSGFGVQIVGIAVNDCPTSLLQFAVLVVLLAVHIRKPAVPELPLCIQRHISGQFKNCALIGIGGSAAICGSVPADEIVALTGKGVGIQGSVHTDFKALRLHTAFAAVGIEGDGVEHTGSCRILCRISGILFSNHNLRAPAGEGVAVVLVRSLICAALEGRHGALQIIFLSYDLTINYPSDMCAGLMNFLALFQQFIADRAVGVAGVTGCRKRRFDRIANFRLVTGSRDHFLRFDNRSADRAVLAFGQTGLSAGWSLCCIDYFCVAGRGDLFHTGENRITNGALRTGCMTSLGAGSGLFRNFNRGMPGCVDCFGLGCIANCAGVGLDTGVLTGRRGRDLALIPTVAIGGNLFLRFDNRSADGAVLAFGQTGLSAGWSLCCIDYFCVAGRGDLFHTGENRITNGALRTGCMTSLGAGSGLFRNFNRGMPGCVDCFGLGCIANCAGVGLDTGVLTGRRGRDLALIPAVALGGNHSLLNERSAADFAVRAFGLAGRGAGRLDGRVNDLGVSLGGDDLAFLHLLVADGAVGVAGVAVCGAGGVLGISHLSDRMAATPLGVEGGVRRQGDLGAICIGGAGAVGFGSPTREIVALAGERVGEQRRSRGGRNLLHLDLRCAGVVRIKDHQKALALEPLVNLEVILILRLTFGGRIASVVIFQSDRVDTDIMRSYVRAALCILIGARLGARGRLHNIAAGLLAGAYVRTVFCGVDRAGRNERTVDIHKGVHQIIIGARTAFRGRI